MWNEINCARFNNSLVQVTIGELILQYIFIQNTTIWIHIADQKLKYTNEPIVHDFRNSVWIHCLFIHQAIISFNPSDLFLCIRFVSCMNKIFTNRKHYVSVTLLRETCFWVRHDTLNWIGRFGHTVWPHISTICLVSQWQYDRKLLYMTINVSDMR